MNVQPGTRLGPYEVLSPLGSGGMGEVWKARDVRLGRLVALKVLRQGDAEPESRRRLLREAQIASRLTHPGICTLHDVGTEGEIDFLVLEMLDGETLHDRLRRGPLGGDELLRVAREMAAGLAHAHAAGFVHRDLKPGNVFLSGSGAKLLDFGLARPRAIAADDGLSSEATASALTAPGVVLGTVGYMSPEQVRGEPAGPPSDVFSFGVVLYEMATGSRPFRGDTAIETLHAILKSDPPPLPPAAAAKGRNLQAIVDRCLEKDPGRRFPSGGELSKALEDLEAVSGEPSTGASRRRNARVGRIGRAAALLAIVAVLTVLAVLAVLAVGFIRSRGRPPADSLAILPLVNETGSPDLEWVGAGLAESVIRMVAREPGIRVMAASTVARFRGARDPVAAGRDLNVQAILTGSVRSAGSRLNVSVSLVDVRDGRHLWGETYEREGAKVPTLAADVAGEVVRALGLRPAGDVRRRAAGAPTADREAYLLALKARYHWGKRTEADLVKALDLFRGAIDRDPTYAPAWAGLAATWDVLGYVGYRPADVAFPRAKDAARKALEIDPEEAGALAVLAHVTWLHDHDATASEALFRKAIAIDPSSLDARHWYAHFLSQTGRREESFRQGRELLELEPLSLVANLHLAEELELQGRPDDAVEQLRRTIDLDRNFYPAWMVLGKLEMGRGRPREALAAFREVERLEPNAPGLEKARAEARSAAGAPAPEPR